MHFVGMTGGVRTRSQCQLTPAYRARIAGTCERQLQRYELVLPNTGIRFSLGEAPVTRVAPVSPWMDWGAAYEDGKELGRTRELGKHIGHHTMAEENTFEVTRCLCNWPGAPAVMDTGRPYHTVVVTGAP